MPTRVAYPAHRFSLSQASFVWSSEDMGCLVATSMAWYDFSHVHLSAELRIYITKAVLGLFINHRCTQHTQLCTQKVKEAASGDGSGKKENLGIDRTKSALFVGHMVALLKKRLLTFKRDKKMWAFVVLMPALFVLFGILILTSVGSYSEPAILLTPAVSVTQPVDRGFVHACALLRARAR